MKLVQLEDYWFNRVEIEWHGPYLWTRAMSGLEAPSEILAEPGVYRAETRGQRRNIIKYIGSASVSFSQRLNGRHRIKSQLVNKHPRQVSIFLGRILPERRITLTRKNYVELEYILQNVHWHDLISYHGLSKLPRTQRGEGWHIVNHGRRGGLHRVIAYPAFAVSGKDI
jgi:hypothetical protein